MIDDDLCDYAALERLWTTRSWFRYVGRTRRQRDGLTKLKPPRGARGLVNGQQMSECSGEIQ